MSKEIKTLVFIFVGVLVAGFLTYQFVLSSQPKYVTENEPSAQSSMPLIGNLASAHSFSTGPLDAKVTVVEFFDPECEACAAVAPQIEKAMKKYEGKVRWVFRYMAFHHNSKNAIQVLEALRKQNLFLDAQHLLFTTQHQWGEKRESTASEILNLVSGLKGVNAAQLKKDIDATATDEVIQKDANEGKQAGVRGTPTFYVNGVILEELNLDLLFSRIEAGLK